MVKLNNSRRCDIQLHLPTSVLDFTPKGRKEGGEKGIKKESRKQKHHLSRRLYKAQNLIFQVI
jgi:hypothetical protein